MNDSIVHLKLLVDLLDTIERKYPKDGSRYQETRFLPGLSNKSKKNYSMDASITDPEYADLLEVNFDTLTAKLKTLDEKITKILVENNVPCRRYIFIMDYISNKIGEIYVKIWKVLNPPIGSTLAKNVVNYFDYADSFLSFLDSSIEKMLIDDEFYNTESPNFIKNPVIDPSQSDSYGNKREVIVDNEVVYECLEYMNNYDENTPVSCCTKAITPIILPSENPNCWQYGIEQRSKEFNVKWLVELKNAILNYNFFYYDYYDLKEITMNLDYSIDKYINTCRELYERINECYRQNINCDIGLIINRFRPKWEENRYLELYVEEIKNKVNILSTRINVSDKNLAKNKFVTIIDWGLEEMKYIFNLGIYEPVTLDIYENFLNSMPLLNI